MIILTMFKFYIINNENVSERINSSKDFDYTVSAFPFVKTEGNDIILQMISDTHFSIITNPDKNLQFHIIAIKHTNNEKNKLAILDCFNKNVDNPNIKKIMTFECNIEKCLECSGLVIREKYLNDVKMECSVHDHEHSIYISNPQITINKTRLSELLA